MFFQNIFGFSAEKLGVSAENYTHGCLIYILWVWRKIFRATFLKQVFKHFKFSGVLQKFPWQHRTILLRVDKIAKSVSRNKLRKKLFQEKKKHYFNFFKILSENFFLLLAKNSRHGCQNCNLRIFSRFWGKTFFFSNWTWFQPSSDCEKKINRAFNPKVLFRVHTTKIRASREKNWGKKRFLFPKFYFSVIAFGVWVISWSFCKVV